MWTQVFIRPRLCDACCVVGTGSGGSVRVGFFLLQVGRFAGAFEMCGAKKDGP